MLYGLHDANGPSTWWLEGASGTQVGGLTPAWG
jgi:hypothetical protein